MIKKFKTGIIEEDSEKVIGPFIGTIKKVVAVSYDTYPNVKLFVRTDDDEVLCDDYLVDNITRFYPRNTIMITQEQTHIEDYVVNGNLYLSITGIGEDEQIANIIIYYDDGVSFIRPNENKL